VSVKYALLALLDFTPSYGLQLHSLMEDTLGDSWSINVGQVYSTLSRLERDKFVKRLPDSELSDEDRNMYAITPEGKKELEEWLREPLSREYRLRDVVFAKLVLSHMSGQVSPDEVLQAQRRQLLKETHELTQLRVEADSANSISWILVLESAIMHLEADMKWLDLCEHSLEKLEEVPPPVIRSRPRGRPPKGEK